MDSEVYGTVDSKWALFEVCGLDDANWVFFDVYGLVDAKWAPFDVYGAVWSMLNGLCLRCTVQFG